MTLDAPVPMLCNGDGRFEGSVEHCGDFEGHHFAWIFPTILQSLRALIERVSLANDKLVSDKLLCEDYFVGSTVPDITPGDFIDRCVKYFKSDPVCYVACAIYLDRVIAAGCLMHSINVHRMFAVALALASKYLQDQTYTNAHYARVLGVPVKEFNRYEISFLKQLGFNLAISKEHFYAHAKQLLASHPCVATTPIVPKKNVSGHHHNNTAAAAAAAAVEKAHVIQPSSAVGSVGSLGSGGKHIACSPHPHLQTGSSASADCAVTQSHQRGHEAEEQGQEAVKKNTRLDPHRSVLHCAVCRRTGHTADSCFHVVGFPKFPTGKRRGRSNRNYAEHTPQPHIQQPHIAATATATPTPTSATLYPKIQKADLELNSNAATGTFSRPGTGSHGQQGRGHHTARRTRSEKRIKKQHRTRHMRRTKVRKSLRRAVSAGNGVGNAAGAGALTGGGGGEGGAKHQCFVYRTARKPTTLAVDFFSAQQREASTLVRAVTV